MNDEYPKCPKCGGKSARIQYGYVDPPPLSVAPHLIDVLNPAALLKATERDVDEWRNDELWQKVRSGDVVLGGYSLSWENRMCRSCRHRWCDK